MQSLRDGIFTGYVTTSINQIVLLENWPAKTKVQTIRITWQISDIVRGENWLKHRKHEKVVPGQAQIFAAKISINKRLASEG